MDKPVTIISCGVFKTEVNQLIQNGEIPGRQVALHSLLHLYPTKLGKTINKAVNLNEDDKVIVFGDCCPAMYEIVNREGVALTRGQNCAEIFLDSRRYKEEMNKGSFFLLPTWVGQWREIFMGHLKLPEDIAREIMHDRHNQFVYINTGLAPVPYDTLQEISSFFALPYEVIDVDIRDSLLAAIRESLNRLGDKHV